MSLDTKSFDPFKNSIHEKRVLNAFKAERMLSPAEIAQITGLTLPQVYRAVHKVRQSIKGSFMTIVMDYAEISQDPNYYFYSGLDSIAGYPPFIIWDSFDTIGDWRKFWFEVLGIPNYRYSPDLKVREGIENVLQFEEFANVIVSADPLVRTIAVLEYQELLHHFISVYSQYPKDYVQLIEEFGFTEEQIKNNLLIIGDHPLDFIDSGGIPAIYVPNRLIGGPGLYLHADYIGTAIRTLWELGNKSFYQGLFCYHQQGKSAQMNPTSQGYITTEGTDVRLHNLESQDVATYFMPRIGQHNKLKIRDQQLVFEFLK